jgi:DNA-binding NtrC family response regulator
MRPVKTRILLVDDEPKISKILTRILTEEGFHLTCADSGEKSVQIARKEMPDIVLMDLNLPGISGIEAMKQILAIHPDVLTIMITAYGSIQSAVEAMRSGSYDYITKPFDNDQLVLTIKRAEEHVQLRREVNELRNQLRERYRFENIIGQSPRMKAVFDRMEKVAETDATVLVQGESGTGKELIVRAIHHASARRKGAFITVNCGAIPANLVESEFFGHEKGAFTDAKETRIGAFERASGGTLFLDEIGELAPDTQVKLLRVLEEKTITRVGGAKQIPVDTRITAATNKSLDAEVQAGHFRQDLFFRLNVFVISLPPVRERREDIPLLIDYFLDLYNNQLGTDVSGISREAVQCLYDYEWPGNVRELANSLHSALIVCQKGTLLPRHLPPRIQGYPLIEETPKSGAEGLEQQVQRMVDSVEKKLILRALEQSQGSRTRAAHTLKISRKTLFNKMQKLKIDDPKDQP